MSGYSRDPDSRGCRCQDCGGDRRYPVPTTDNPLGCNPGHAPSGHLLRRDIGHVHTVGTSWNGRAWPAPNLPERPSGCRVLVPTFRRPTGLRLATQLQHLRRLDLTASAPSRLEVRGEPDTCRDSVHGGVGGDTGWRDGTSRGLPGGPSGLHACQGLPRPVRITVCAGAVRDRTTGAIGEPKALQSAECGAGCVAWNRRHGWSESVDREHRTLPQPAACGSGARARVLARLGRSALAPHLALAVGVGA